MGKSPLLKGIGDLYGGLGDVACNEGTGPVPGTVSSSR
jgi:hypothetical protein